MTKIKKIRNYIYILLFLLMIAFPILHMNKVNGAISLTENRNLATFPELFDENGRVLKSFKGDFESWLGDNIGFRKEFVELHGLMEYKIFNRSPSDKIQIGKENWLFYTKENNLEIVGKENQIESFILQRIANQQQLIYNKLKESGMDYVLVLPPSKTSVYPEFLKNTDISGSDYTPNDMIYEYLTQNTDVNVISLKEDLQKAKMNEDVFYKTDTHWNSYGAYIAYQTIIEKMSYLGLLDNNIIARTSFKPIQYKGDLAGMFGNSSIIKPEDTKKLELVEPKARLQEESEYYDIIRSAMGENVGISIYKNDFIEDDTTAVLFSDSMMADPSKHMPELMAENFNQYIVIWNTEIHPEVIEKIKPDLVISSLSERYIEELYMHSRNFIPFTEDDVELTSACEEIDRSENNTIEITIKNRRKEGLNKDLGTSLAILPDGKDLGYYISIPDNKDINYNEEYKFYIENIEQYLGDASSVSFQMIHLGYKYFGNIIEVKITE